MSGHKRNLFSLARILVLGSLLCAGLISCSKDTGPRSMEDSNLAVDLIAEYPFAEKVQDSTGIDIGSPESLRKLGAGWASPEGERRKHIWGVGPKSIIRFMNLSE